MRPTTYEAALLVVEDDVRPAGKPGFCFYCGAALGTEHNAGCVLHPDTTLFARIDWLDTKTNQMGTFDEWEDRDSCGSLREEDGQINTWMWEEGNYACDCNRALFFIDADWDDEEFGCGDGRFIIQRMQARRWGQEPFNISYSEELTN